MDQTQPAKSIGEIAEAMKDIDFAMLNTHTEGGQIGARPMSNNREVEYDGESVYFTWQDNLMVADIERDPKVGLSFQGKGSFTGKPGMFIAVEGEAAIVRDKARFAAHWNKELDRWFEQGPDTPGVVMIQVRASRIAYWDGDEEGELKL